MIKKSNKKGNEMASMSRDDVLRVAREARDKGESAKLQRANLWSANLQRANLRDANLYGADLQRANLWSANLQRANLRYATLRGADLRNADLRGAELYGADLRNADLRGADLRNANLRDADLRDADLRDADLWSATLRGANLLHAELYGADLRGAKLWSIDLHGVLWHGLFISRLPSGQLTLTPTCDGWQIDIGCWNGAPDQLRDLITQDDGWPEAEGDEITRRRPYLQAALALCEVHMADHADVIDALKERWGE